MNSMKKWLKRGLNKNLEEFVKNNTNLSIEELVRCDKDYKIQRLDDAVVMIKTAVSNGTHITVVGDYDGDGIDALIIFILLLSTLGAKYSIIVPKRMSEGYGISEKIVKRITDGLVITVDNGIKAIEPIKELKRRGCQVFVLDHHEANDDGLLPPADLIIDPSAIPNSADFRDYCGAGLTYKLAIALLGKNHPVIPYMSCFAAIGTITDSVSLVEDNRNIVSEGLRNISNPNFRTVGLSHLISYTKVNPDYVESDDIGFYLGPCINAPGRLVDNGGELVINGLLATNIEQAELFISKVVSLNETRKDMTEEIMSGIDMEELKNPNRKSCFIYRKSIPEGIIGIVAGRIAEQTGKPTFVMSDDEHGNVKGSSRAKLDSNRIVDILNKSSDLLLKFGGHKKAGGFSLLKENVMVFEKRVESLAVREEFDASAVYYDVEIYKGDVISVYNQLNLIKPFGEGNPMPTFLIRDIPIKSFNYLKDAHLKLNFGSFSAIGFSMKDAFEEKVDKSSISIIGKIKTNFYKGQQYIQIMIEDFE